MTSSTFELLAQLLSPSEHIPKRNVFGRQPIEARKQITDCMGPGKPRDLVCISQKTRKLLGPGNHPAKLPKQLSGVSQSTRKLLTPKNTSFFPVDFTGTHYLPKSVFGSVFLVLA